MAEQVFLERLNDVRAQPAAYGRSIGVDLSYVLPATPLAFDTRLIAAAHAHSVDMNIRDFFSHTGSDGDSAGERLTRRRVLLARLRREHHRRAVERHGGAAGR